MWEGRQTPSLLLSPKPAADPLGWGWGLKGAVSKKGPPLEKPLWRPPTGSVVLCPLLWSSGLADSAAEPGGRRRPKTKGHVGERVEWEAERSWVGSCSAPPSLSPAWESQAERGRYGSPFRGGFSSCLVNYAGPASGWP